MIWHFIRKFISLPCVRDLCKIYFLVTWSFTKRRSLRRNYWPRSSPVPLPCYWSTPGTVPARNTSLLLPDSRPSGRLSNDFSLLSCRNHYPTPYDLRLNCIVCLSISPTIFSDRSRFVTVSFSSNLPLSSRASLLELSNLRKLGLY